MSQKILSWKNRDVDLQKVLRFYDPKRRFEVMYYRTNLLVHTKRVEAITKTLIPLAQECYEGFDPKLASLISRHHDDHELISKRGDVSLQLKLQMDNSEKEAMKIEEIRAIEKMCRFYPKMIDGYSYKKILMHSLHKDCREAQLPSLVDKHDGDCESIHEVLAGNTVFLEPVLNYSYGTFAERVRRFPLIKEMFVVDISKQNHFLQFPVLDFMEFFENGNLKTIPHNEQNIRRNSRIPSYEAWKEITLKTFPNGLELLTEQKEFQKEP